jgi:predicted ester cyclase
MKTIKCLGAIVTLLLLVVLTSCEDQQARDELAKFKELENKKARNIELVKEFYQHLDKFLNEGDQKAFMNLWSSDSKRFGGSSDQSMSIEDMTPFLKTYYSAFPDLKHHLLIIIAENDYVVVQVKYTGTQVGEFMGIAPSQKKIECKGTHIFKLDAGKIAELHFLDDDFTMFSQLGHQPK